MIGAGILFKTDSDRKEDFQDVFPLGPALTDGYRIASDETDHGRSD